MDLKRFYSLNFLGRLLLSAIFVNSALLKLVKFDISAEYLSNQGIPLFLSEILVFAAIPVLLIGLFFLIFTKNIKIGSSLLLTFLIPTTVIFHVVNYSNPNNGGLTHLLSNLALIGGLFLAIDKSDH
tara:strand:+ start:1009 stop:1389 length:381 start_codon:yes stop_codon:yes gene_type:complete